MASPGKPPVKRPHKAGAFRPPALEKTGSPADVGEAITNRNKDLFSPPNEPASAEGAAKRRIASKIWR